MLTHALITLIIPTYRRPALLKAAIRSALAQTFAHVEVHVFDDASGDDTESVVKELAKDDARVKYFLHPKNVGSNNNFQYGLTHVTTPFFAFLSDDDLVMPTFLEEAMLGFAMNPDAGLFIGGHLFIDEKHELKGFELHQWADKSVYTPQEIIKNFLEGRFAPWWGSIVFRKEVRDKIGRLNSALLCHDAEYIVRAMTQFSVIISKTPCAIFRFHATNVSYTLRLKDLEDMGRAYVTSLNHAGFVHAEIEQLVSRRIHDWLLGQAIEAFAKQGYQESLKGVAALQKRGIHNRKTMLLGLFAKSSQQFGLFNVMCSLLIRWRRPFARLVTRLKFRKLVSRHMLEQLNKTIMASKAIVLYLGVLYYFS